MDNNIFINFCSTLKDNYLPLLARQNPYSAGDGDVIQVELLVPKLTSLRWVEGDGVVLIWGGTLTEPPDVSLFDAIRKLHRRPLDGIVWVTPTFQHWIHWFNRHLLSL